MAEPTVLAFDEFWQWLQGHANCIVSAGTPDSVLYDHDDFHWHFSREVGPEGQEELVVQVMRGKNLVGELLIPHSRMTHVQVEPRGTDGEFVFECFEEIEEGPVVSYSFVLSHGHEVEERAPRQARWVH